MIDYSKSEYEGAPLPNLECDDVIKFCLNQLYNDNTKHSLDEIVDGLTFEEVIGAFRLAQEKIDQLQNYIYDLEEENEMLNEG